MAAAYGALFIAALLVVPSSASAEDAQPEYRWQYGSSISQMSGDYGEDGDTDLLYIPFTAKRYLSRGDIAVTIPYARISSDVGATVVDGAVSGTTDSGSSDDSGLGDLILKGRYYVAQQNGSLPYIDLAGKLKMPTASADDGLGTGEADLSIQLECSRWVSREWLWLAELGYTWIGDPAGVDYDNRIEYSIGAGRVLDSSWQVGGYLDGRTAITEGNDAPLSILLYGEYRHRDDLRFDAMLEVGLSDGSPDIGLTVGVRIKRW